MLRVVRSLALLSFLLLLPARLGAQGGTIRGHIADSAGAAVQQVAVIVEGTGFRGVTNDDGDYTIARIPAGTYILHVRRLGFSHAPVRVEVRDGQVTRQDFTLTAVPMTLSTTEIVVGSRARHTAADELAVPVDVFPLEKIQQQGTSETAQILSQLAPSVNFQRQSVADASEIVRPFTMRGLSPDHTLVLVNGRRRHRTAVVNYFGAGIGSGASGVDLNALPASMIDHIEVLRDGAASQYGSDAIAGVVNIVTKQGAFDPTFSVEGGEYVTGGAPNRGGAFTDGATVDMNAGWGIPIGRGALDLFAEYRDRNPTNRAGADNSDQLAPGDANQVDDHGNIISQNNAVPMPNYHWGDGASKDVMTFLNATMPLGGESSTGAVYAFGGYSNRSGTGFGYYRNAISDRNWPQIYPQGYLPEFHPTVIDASGALGVRGILSDWRYDIGGSYGYNSFNYRLNHTLNVSLGPCLVTACAPGPDSVFGTADDPGPNKTSFNAGTVKLWEAIGTVDLSRDVEVGLASPLTISFGGQVRRENYQIQSGEYDSYVQGNYPNQFGDIAAAGSQVFPGLRPQDAVDAFRNNVAGYVELESSLVTSLLAQVAGRLEHYSDFGSKVTGKLALRFQPTHRWTFRGAVSNGFRAPSLSQSYYSQIATNFEPDSNGKPVPFEVGIFPVNSPEARALGARPLKAENSVNVSTGAAFSPTPNATFTLDYYWIKLDDRIQLSTAIQGDSVAAILANIGSRAVAAQYMTNAIDTRTQGIDLTAALGFDVGRGRLTVDPAFNWTENRVVRVAPIPAALQGTGVTTLFDPFYEGGLLSLTKERPRWRATVTAGYGVGAWSFMARSLSFGSYTSALYSYSGSDAQTYGGQTIFDAEVGYAFRAIKVTLGARNLFDTYPPFMTPNNSFLLFPYPSASPYGFNGRFLYTRLELVPHR